MKKMKLKDEQEKSLTDYDDDDKDFVYKMSREYINEESGTDTENYPYYLFNSKQLIQKLSRYTTYNFLNWSCVQSYMVFQIKQLCCRPYLILKLVLLLKQLREEWKLNSQQIVSILYFEKFHFCCTTMFYCNWKSEQTGVDRRILTRGDSKYTMNW